MATSFPTGLDAIQRVVATDLRNAPGKEGHVLHNNVCDAVEALQAKVGVNGSAVPGSIDKRLVDVEDAADAVTSDLSAHEVAADPHTVYALRSDLPAALAEHDIYLPRDVPTIAPASTTCYLFAHPATQANHKQLGQREIFVPLQIDPVDGIQWYYGTCFGTKASANMVPSICDTGLFKPALHVFHTSLTKVGTWTTGPASVAVGAFTAAGGSYSVTAGDTISGSVTGRAVGIRWYGTSNGGFGVVAIDGDYTLATRLPEFTNSDYLAGLCRLEDVGRRYLGTYYAASWNDATVIADDLAPGAHTITVQATGTKPAASSSFRCYVEAFFGVGGGALGSANVYAVPMHWVCHLAHVSAQCYVPQGAPVGSSDYQFMGENHSDNSTQSKETTTGAFTVYVGDVDQTALATGTWASDSSIAIYHTTTIAHKADLVTPVATKVRKYTLMAGRKHPCMCDVTVTWSSAFVLEIEYAAMLTIGALSIAPESGVRNLDFTEGEIARQTFPLLDTSDGTVYYYRGEDRKVFARGPKVEAWAAVLEESAGSAMHSAHAGSYQDRSTPGEEKLYVITSNGTQYIPSGTVRRFVVGWGARRIDQ